MILGKHIFNPRHHINKTYKRKIYPNIFNNYTILFANCKVNSFLGNMKMVRLLSNLQARQHIEIEVKTDYANRNCPTSNKDLKFSYIGAVT